jgi:HSP20 family protein
MYLIPKTRGNGPELERLQTRMNRLIDEFFTGGVWPLAETAADWAPVLDLAETANEVVVKTEIPGMDAKDIDVSIAGDVLTVKGEKKVDREEKGKTWHRMERAYGTFQRMVELPCAVEADKIRAKYENGVLVINVPKREEARTKPIKIDVK